MVNRVVVHSPTFADKLASVSAVQRLKICTIYHHDSKVYLPAFKREMLKQPNIQRHQCDFVCSTGIGSEELKKLEAKYDWLVIICHKSFELLDASCSFAEAAGSIFRHKILVCNDPHQIFTVPHAKFLIDRFLSKIFKPEIFLKFPEFRWGRVKTAQDFSDFYALAQTAVACAVDIETTKSTRGIMCIGFSLLLPNFQIYTGVLDCEDEDYFPRLRALLALPVASAFQNGLYDNLYLLRWGSPCNNYCFDTSYFFHAWYSELPKDLGFLGSFFIRDFTFWKDEGKNPANKDEYHRYNAKDAYATLCIMIAQLCEAPQWAKDNFAENFPLVFPCLYMNAHGLRVNEEIRKECADEAEEIYAAKLKELQICTSVENFNPGSPQQVTKFFAAYGCPLAGTDEKTLSTAASAHPLLEIFAKLILDCREQKKALSQYFNPDLYHGRLLYTMHLAGTETGRFASQKSSFWCGAQIQNQPAYAKCFIEAEAGHCIIEVDNEQSESRCTALLAEDQALWDTLHNGKDFHSTNAELFFGVPYEVAAQKTPEGKDSPPRAMGKKINHAVSYNMAARMFVYQAGAKFMEDARRALRLPLHLSHVAIAEYLIGIFDRTYPKVRNDFQSNIKREISMTQKLRGPTGWTRVFFNDPALTKPALNAAVAHGPQSLSVRILNRGLLRVYQEMLKGAPIRLCAQIHDSILLQAPIERADEMTALVQHCMVNPVEYKGRTLIIPTAAKNCGQFWAKRKKK